MKFGKRIYKIHFFSVDEYDNTNLDLEEFHHRHEETYKDAVCDHKELDDEYHENVTREKQILENIMFDEDEFYKILFEEPEKIEVFDFYDRFFPFVGFKCIVAIPYNDTKLYIRYDAYDNAYDNVSPNRYPENDDEMRWCLTVGI